MMPVHCNLSQPDPRYCDITEGDFWYNTKNNQ